MVEKIADACGGYDCRSEKNGFHVSRAGIKENGGGNGRCEVRLNQDFTVYCNISNCSFGYVLERLFSLSGNDFCISAGTDSKIGRAVFNAENFDQALGLLCENGNFEMNESDGIYYFWPSKNRDGISSQGKFWGKYDLKFAKYSEINGLLMKRFSEVETVSFNGEQKFLYFAKDSEIVPFCKFVEELDKEKFTKLVQLKYIRTEEFLKNLPPFLERSQISDSGKGDSFYFSGSEEAYEQLVSRISEVDRPNSTIRYDLLIMQYQNVDGKSWSPGFRAGMVSMGDRNAASGILGSVLNFNLDIVGAFGMKFAMDLQTSINQSKAKVYADTTLNGINGAKINFANTNTYRYRDNNLDPETGEPIYSGITKEIVSGLKLEITGTVTGDGMITSKITASVSRQGTDLSTTTGNPPPTSEKVITTEVRVKSGEPVVLSGLVQNEEVENASRTPFISRIPLLGKFFKAEDKSKEQTELVIYLVPTAEIWKGEEKDV
ncbi:MAG: type II and III secretion system protein, partial [Treponema sp.]|nr:type II and III secretion system protein [Candidatus Treponema equifaecale]